MSNEAGGSQPNAFPTVQELCLDVPLFESFHIADSTFKEFWDLVKFDGHIDCHCLECGQPSIFHANESNDWPWGRDDHRPLVRNNHLFKFAFNCSRNANHKLIFYFRLHNRNFMKIGQYPTIADLSTIEVQKYRKVLGEELYKEFTRAIGLVSHGVGIGAFVYLRRIFEHLIEEAHQKNAATEGWDEDAYKKSRMDDKIELLKASLPDFLVRNRTLYSILSKGIHELDESICLSAFRVTRTGIEMILDEKLRESEQEQKTQAAAKDIEQLHNELKSLDS